MPTHRQTFREAQRERVLIFDGAMGSNLQAQNLTADDFGGKKLEGAWDGLVLSKPSAVAKVHRSFYEVGCDVVETCTFQSSRRRLEEWGLGDRARELNVGAARLARSVGDECERADGRQRFVAGSIGPTGMLPSSKDPVLGAVTPKELHDTFLEQAEFLIEGGVDALIIETQQDILETKHCLLGAKEAVRRSGRDVFVMVQPTLTQGRMLLGTDIRAALTTIQALGADSIGLNCSTGPQEMVDPVRHLCEHARIPISILPNAGIPLNMGGGVAHYPLTPDELAAAHHRFVFEHGVGIIGGCCGTTPAHLKAVVDAIGRTPPKKRTVVFEPLASSAMAAASLVQIPAPTLIGERVNSQGSRKIKELLIADDLPGIVPIAREQAEGGAHLLDVCVALTERNDEKSQLSRLVKELSLAVPSPLVLDSTDAAAIAEALDWCPGRAVVNSINLENGRERCDAVLPLVARHGAAVIALCIDKDLGGMAKTRDVKLAVARKIHDIAVKEYGLTPDALIFDALTFTLATGQDEFRKSALETIEGIRLIKKELPGVLTTLGVSNVSFGLSPVARAVINSVFLHHCVQAGLDTAIVNPRDITPYSEIPEEDRRLTDDLIFDRVPDALTKLIARYEGKKKAKSGGNDQKAEVFALPPAERAHRQIVLRIPDEIEVALDACMKERTPVAVINEVLLPAMKEVGDKFGLGELILPFVLQSAEVMKRAVSHVEKFLDKNDSVTRGKVVLATVYGDVHDIGKNLVKTILSNNGFEVFDLGKQVPVQTIIDKAVEIGADAIGLSALLVSTSKQMPICAEELSKQGKRFPVIVGGAAINRTYGQRCNRLPDGSLYAGGVFYAKDAFEGLALVQELTDPARKKKLMEALPLDVAEAEGRAERRTELRAATRAAKGESKEVPARSATPVLDAVPAAPFIGARTLGPEEIPLAELFECFDLKSLFRLSWGVPSEKEAEFRSVLEGWKKAALARPLVVPRASYGYFRCRADGDAIVVEHPDGKSESRFAFPRQTGGERLCLADYVRALGGDVIALSCVTVGHEATREGERLNAEGKFNDAYLLHGFATQSAEALAEWLHRRIRRELGIEPKRGQRFSFGYPACPDIELQGPLCALLGAEKIGVELTSAFQLVPEQSTTALVLHHPAAKYFSAVPDGAPSAQARPALASL